MCAQSDELHEADRNDAKDRKESSSFEDEDEDETDEEIVMDLKTALSVLELTEPVTTDGVQKAYRKQALRFHPDKLLNTDTGETMKQINEARIVVLKHISEGTKETKR
jgi:DnaJ-domain-containing protein 1